MKLQEAMENNNMEDRVIYAAPYPGTYWFLEDDIKYYSKNENKLQVDDWEKYNNNDRNRGNKYVYNYVTTYHPCNIFLKDGIIDSVALMTEKEIKDLNMSSQQTGEKIDIYGINGLYGDILKNRVSMGYEEEKLSFDDWLVHGNIIPSETCNHEWKEVELFVSKKTYCTKCDMEKK